MLYIRDDNLKLAFTTMINKLVYCHKLVLKPYLKALQENTGDASLLRIQQLEILLEQNTEQRETLHKLMGQGYIDQILFTQENNALLSEEPLCHLPSEIDPAALPSLPWSSECDALHDPLPNPDTLKRYALMNAFPSLKDNSSQHLHRFLQSYLPVLLPK